MVEVPYSCTFQNVRQGMVLLQLAKLYYITDDKKVSNCSSVRVLFSMLNPVCEWRGGAISQTSVDISYVLRTIWLQVSVPFPQQFFLLNKTPPMVGTEIATRAGANQQLYS